MQKVINALEKSGSGSGAGSGSGKGESADQKDEDGKSKMTEEMKATMNAQSKTIIDVRPLCFTAPLTRVVMARSCGSTAVSMHGPSGAKVSKLLARVNCTSFFCRSRAVTSLAHV